MGKSYPSEREPARVVKCPYCDHKGSARGLFSHIRLSHPNKVEKSRELVSERRSHPCDVKSGKIGNLNRNNRKIRMSDDDALITLIGVVAFAVINAYSQRQSLSRGGYKSPSETMSEIERLKPQIARTLGSIW
jgi:hypothetical protein